jgi:hypothetical protein
MCIKGDWQNDEQHGSGEQSSKDGSTYIGQFERGQFHGQGQLTLPNHDVDHTSKISTISSCIECVLVRVDIGRRIF